MSERNIVKVTVGRPARIVKVLIAGPQGPRGENGSGSHAYVHEQPTALGTWVIPHELGRKPSVSVFLLTGEEVDTDTVATSTVVTLTFATPTAGSAVLI